MRDTEEVRASTEEPKVGTPASQPANILALQRTIGNRAVGALLRRAATSRAGRVQLQRGIFDGVTALWHGARMYGWELDEDTDPGAPFARELMFHWAWSAPLPFFRSNAHQDPAVLSIGDPNPHRHTGAEWADFMLRRQEIREEAVLPTFSRLARTFGVQTPHRGTFEEHLHDLTLDRTFSMSLTLHGVHDFKITGSYAVDQLAPDVSRVRFFDVVFEWIDVGAMHTSGAGTDTITPAGERINDRAFQGSGSNFPISIEFRMPGTSVWLVRNGGAMHGAGYPHPGSYRYASFVGPDSG
jgi:hypothetical protein